MRHLRFAALLFSLVVAWIAGPASSQPLRIALVIANSNYAGMPGLTRCPPSSALVRDTLRDKGFEVIERNDLSRGEFDAAIGALARRAAASPGTFAALYYCGYALEFNGRSFLLPVSANLSRDNDVLTQGIISKSVVDSLARVADSSGVVLLDVFQPSGTTQSGLARLVDQIQPGRFAVIGAGNDSGGSGPTAASQALRDNVAGDKVSLERFVDGVRDQLAKWSVIATHIVAATGQPSFLVGQREVPPPPTVLQATAPPPAATAPQPVAPPEPRAAAVAPAPPTPPQITMVDEDRMSDQDRRLVQVVLATLGYYSGRIDATFGPETKAAIRRYQFEIKAEMTGRLTGEQATKLVNGVR